MIVTGLETRSYITDRTFKGGLGGISGGVGGGGGVSNG